MRRILSLSVTALLIAVVPTPGVALTDIARCEGVAGIPRLESSCTDTFTLAPGGGVFLIPHAGQGFTGSLRVQVSDPTAGYAISTFYVLGRRMFSTVNGRPYQGDTLRVELSAGAWKLTVTAGVRMIDGEQRLVALGPFDGVAAA